MAMAQVGVAHGHGDVFMPHQLFHCGEVDSGHDKPTGKGMPQVMKGHVGHPAATARSYKHVAKVAVWGPLVIQKHGRCGRRCGRARSTFPANMGNERRAGCEATTELTTKPESSMMLQSVWRTKRSIDMTSDSGLISQDSDDPQARQEVLDERHQMQQTPRRVTNPDALETLERESRQRTDHLGSFLVGYPMQQALDSAALQAEQAQLVSQWPKPLKNDGKVQVRVRTAQGLAVPVWVA